MNKKLLMYVTVYSKHITHGDVAHGKNVRSWCDGSLDQSFMVDPLNYLSFQPVIHNWCNEGHGMCYPSCLWDDAYKITLAANRKE